MQALSHYTFWSRKVWTVTNLHNFVHAITLDLQKHAKMLKNEIGQTNKIHIFDTSVAALVLLVLSLVSEQLNDVEIR